MTIDPIFKAFVEDLTKIATSVTKLGIFIGAACIIAYCRSIGYFPQDLSLGDGLLFLMAACCFGLFYALFVASLVSLGIFVSPAIVKANRLYVRIWNAVGKTTKTPLEELAPFNAGCVGPAVLGVVLIWGLGRQSSVPSLAWILLFLLSISLYLVYSLYKSIDKKLKRICVVQRSPLESPHKEEIADLGDPSRLRTLRWITAGVIAFAPLFLGQVGTPLLTGAMRFAKIRLEHPTVYLKSPYSLMLPQDLRAKYVPALGDYTRFDGATVLFWGFGKTTVIAFPDHLRERTLKVPNDQIIIE